MLLEQPELCSQTFCGYLALAETWFLLEGAVNLHGHPSQIDFNSSFRYHLNEEVGLIILRVLGRMKIIER